MTIRELFKQKLEKAEIIPGDALSSAIMRRVARREFIRFNPTRFNVYYLGGLLVAGVTALVILTSEKDEILEKDLSPADTSVVYKPLTAKVVNSSTQKSISQKAEFHQATVSITSKTTEKSVRESGFPKEEEIFSKTRQDHTADQAGINDSFVINGIITKLPPEKNTLKGGFRSNQPLFETSADKGCAPFSVQFYIKSDSYDSCRWTFGDGGYSIEKNPEWIFDVEGEFKVVLNVFGTNGINMSSSAIITVYPVPHASFEIAAENAVIPDDEVKFINYSSNASIFNWDFGDGSTSDYFEPSHKYTRIGNYNVKLRVTSEKGCSDSLTVLNAFAGSEYFIDFPNAFIPNMQGPSGGYYSSKSDEVAQVFHPESSGVSDYQLKIFSRLGILIFESNDIHIGWDGYFKGQLSEPGVYIWKVRGNFSNGEPFTRMGDVTLLRN